MFVRKERTLLIHGVEADWIEEEMTDDDVDFIKDVLETKLKAVFQKAGLMKKMSFMKLCRWKTGRSTAISLQWWPPSGTGDSQTTNSATLELHPSHQFELTRRYGFSLRPRFFLPFGQKKSLLCCFCPVLAVFNFQ